MLNDDQRLISPIRRFTSEDIPQVADLHRKVFGLAPAMTPDLHNAYRAYFTDVFLSNLRQGEMAGSSLVYQEKTGRITGFLAVMPKRMVFAGQVLQARIASQFVVDPELRGFAGLKLMSAALAGPQDLTIADESNAVSRKLWEFLGGTTSHLYSMRWFYPLRPSRCALLVLNVLKQKKLLPSFLPSLITAAAAPAARLLDALTARFTGWPLHPAAKYVHGEELDCRQLLTGLASAGRQQAIRFEYDESSLKWLLQRAEQLRRNGSLQKVLVKTDNNEVAGWYLYYLSENRLSEVIQIHASPAHATAVLDHLVAHAWNNGAIGLSGRMEPSLMQAFSNKHCLLHCGPEWTLVHSRRPELLQAFSLGTAGFSRLDGEWCLHFR